MLLADTIFWRRNYKQILYVSYLHITMRTASLRALKADFHWGTARHDSARTQKETVSIRAQLALRGTVCSFLREGCMATKFCIDLTQACGDMM